MKNNKFIKDDRGVVAITTGILFPIIILFIAFGMELAHLRIKNDFYQSVADAVAVDLGHNIASMCNGETCSLSYLQNDANIEAEKNGCTKENNCTVNVTWPFNNDDRKVSVSIQNNFQFFFISKTIINNVQAVVSQNVALNNNGITYSSGCVLSLNDLTLNNTNISNKNCEVIGLKSAKATSTTNIKGVLTSSGSISTNENALIYYTNPNQTNIVDSYNNKSNISSSTESSLSCLDATPLSSMDLQPGRYCNVLQPSDTTVTFEPGIFYFDQGISSSGSTFNGKGVTIIFGSNANVDFESSKINLTAPTSDANTDTTGIVMTQFNDDTNNVSYTFKNTDTTMTGTIYLPNKNFVITNGSFTTYDEENGCGQLIGYDMSFDGTSVDLGNMCSDAMGTRPIGTQKTGWQSSNSNNSDISTAHPVLTE